LKEYQGRVQSSQSVVIGGAGATGVEVAGEIGFEYGFDVGMEYGDGKEITLVSLLERKIKNRC